MVGTSLSIFAPGVRGHLLAIKQTARTYDSIQNTLATGKTVNSAVDNAPKFFTASALSSEANDLNRLLDRISQSVSTIKTAETALSSVDALLTEADDLIQEANGVIDSSRQDIGDVILADDPIIYYRLNETNTNIIENLGTEGVTSAGRYQGGYTLDTGPLHQGDNSASVTLDGTNGRINIPNSIAFNRDPNGYSQKTVELTFEAEDLTGRQVLFEVGGSGNNSGFSIYLDNDDLYFVANDDANFGLVSVQSSVKIEVGVTYHASFVFDADSRSFTGYLNGEVAGTAEVTGIIRRQSGGGLGRSTNGANFHDGVNPGNGEYFQGKLADFAVYNAALTQADIQERYDVTQLATTQSFETRISNILENINPFVEDTSYLGVNLLDGFDLTVYFDLDQESTLKVEGRKFSTTDFGLDDVSLKTKFDLNSSLRNFDSATDSLKEFISSLSNDLSVINNRREYTENKINTLKAGSDDLVVADQNEESANLIAVATRQTIQIEALSLASNPITVASFL